MNHGAGTISNVNMENNNGGIDAITYENSDDDENDDNIYVSDIMDNKRLTEKIIEDFSTRCSVGYDYDINKWMITYHIHYDWRDRLCQLNENIITRLTSLSLLKVVDSANNEIWKIIIKIKNGIDVYIKIAEDTIHFRKVLKNDYSDIIDFSKYAFDSYNCDVHSLTNSDSDDLLNIFEQLKQNFLVLLKLKYNIESKIRELEKQNDYHRNLLYTPYDYSIIKNLLNIKKQTRTIMQIDKY